MHPKMMIAVGHEVESDRQRNLMQIDRRSLALQLRRMGATKSPTRIAGQGFVRCLLVVPRLLMRVA